MRFFLNPCRLLTTAGAGLLFVFAISCSSSGGGCQGFGGH